MEGRRDAAKHAQRQWSCYQGAHWVSSLKPLARLTAVHGHDHRRTPPSTTTSDPWMVQVRAGAVQPGRACTLVDAARACFFAACCVRPGRVSGLCGLLGEAYGVCQGLSCPWRQHRVLGESARSRGRRPADSRWPASPWTYMNYKDIYSVHSQGARRSPTGGIPIHFRSFCSAGSRSSRGHGPPARCVSIWDMDV